MQIGVESKITMDKGIRAWIIHRLGGNTGREVSDLLQGLMTNFIQAYLGTKEGLKLIPKKRGQVKPNAWTLDFSVLKGKLPKPVD
jgi:hypothetical protein